MKRIVNQSYSLAGVFVLTAVATGISYWQTPFHTPIIGMLHNIGFILLGLVLMSLFGGGRTAPYALPLLQLSFIATYLLQVLFYPPEFDDSTTPRFVLILVLFSLPLFLFIKNHSWIKEATAKKETKPVVGYLFLLIVLIEGSFIFTPAGIMGTVLRLIAVALAFKADSRGWYVFLAAAILETFFPANTVQGPSRYIQYIMATPLPLWVYYEAATITCGRANLWPVTGDQSGS